MMKWVCGVCGYVHEGPTPPESVPSVVPAVISFQRLLQLTG